jgi:hypothetical protein
MITSLGYTREGNISQRLDSLTLTTQAVASFNMAYSRGRLMNFFARLTRRNNHLQELTSQPVETQHRTSKIVSVSIDQIKGTLGRSTDFDADFNPLRERSRSRWISIMNAMQMGVSLPPVELVQVGETYYVRDGHHRISVARSLQQEAIDARIVN